MVSYPDHGSGYKKQVPSKPQDSTKKLLIYPWWRPRLYFAARTPIVYIARLQSNGAMLNLIIIITKLRLSSPVDKDLDEEKDIIWQLKNIYTLHV